MVPEIPVRCRTNLDLSGEQWPSSLPAVPTVGHTIQSLTRHKHFQLSLEVVSVEWRYDGLLKQWYASIELHMNSFQRQLPAKNKNAATGSIVAFYEWYAPMVGSSVGAFI